LGGGCPCLRHRGEQAAVLGGAAPVSDGASGGALALDGTDDAVRLPRRDQLELDTRDFTVSLWFRSTAGDGEQPLLSIGGIGGSQPQIRLWTEPTHDRLRGLLWNRALADTELDDALLPGTVLWLPMDRVDRSR